MMKDLFSLEGRVALVTGGSAGIGLASAVSLAAEGCNLVLVSRDQGKLDKAVNLIGATTPVSVVAMAADVGDDTSHARIAEAFPDIDILVNNAGAIPGGGLDRLDQAQFRSGWELKVFGFIGLTREYYARMKARGSGCIVNVIGASGTRPDANYIAGSAGNSALTTITHALGAEAPAYGLRVNAVSPGAVATERQEGVLRKLAAEKLGDEDRWFDFTSAFPFGRMARPEEVGDVVTFLASPRASYISGVVVNVDGGMSQQHNWWPSPKG